MTDLESRIREDLDAIRKRYEARRARSKRSPGQALFESRLRFYDRAFKGAGVLPMTGKSILDVGCGGGKWLDICCRRWGAEPTRCFGVDLRASALEQWRLDHPESRIELRHCAAHDLPYDDASFDVVHQSMLFSSVLDADHRACISAELWRLLRPGGAILWYDMWINPLNPHTAGMRAGEIRRLFPEVAHVRRWTITVAAPLARLVPESAKGILPWVERLRVFNTHYLVAMRKAGGPARTRPEP